MHTMDDNAAACSDRRWTLIVHLHLSAVQNALCLPMLGYDRAKILTYVFDLRNYIRTV